MLIQPFVKFSHSFTPNMCCFFVDDDASFSGAVTKNNRIKIHLIRGEIGQQKVRKSQRFYLGKENLILPRLSYPGCHLRATYIGCIGTHTHGRQMTSLLC